MPTMAAVTTTAGYFLASKMGLITGNSPVVYWISAAYYNDSTWTWYTIANLRVHFELRKNEADISRIQKLMKRYVKVVAVQAALQFIIIFIMAEFATGFSLHL